MQARGEKTRVDKYHKKWQGLRAFFALSIRGKGREERDGRGNKESRRQVTVMQVVQSLASGTTSVSSSIFEV